MLFIVNTVLFDGIYFWCYAVVHWRYNGPVREMWGNDGHFKMLFVWSD